MLHISVDEYLHLNRGVWELWSLILSAWIESSSASLRDSGLLPAERFFELQVVDLRFYLSFLLFFFYRHMPSSISPPHRPLPHRAHSPRSNFPPPRLSLSRLSSTFTSPISTFLIPTVHIVRYVVHHIFSLRTSPSRLSTFILTSGTAPVRNPVNSATHPKPNSARFKPLETQEPQEAVPRAPDRAYVLACLLACLLGV